MLGRADDTPLFAGADAGRRTTVAVAAAGPHLDEDQRSVAVAQHQVDLSARRMRSTGESIIAAFEPQPLALQMGQRTLLGLVAQ